jgi:hypothetical protein
LCKARRLQRGPVYRRYRFGKFKKIVNWPFCPRGVYWLGSFCSMQAGGVGRLHRADMLHTATPPPRRMTTRAAGRLRHSAGGYRRCRRTNSSDLGSSTTSVGGERNLAANAHVSASSFSSSRWESRSTQFLPPLPLVVDIIGWIDSYARRWVNPYLRRSTYMFDIGAEKFC